MSSIIPKINIGAPKTFKSADNLSFDCQTTANIGAVQPTLCRELVPHAKAKVSARTLIRLASMPVPTFGRLSQRDYYTFVRMSDLYEPWAEFLASQPYTNTSGTSFIPSKLPFFAVDDISQFIFEYSYFWIQSGKNPLKTFVVDSSNEASFKALIQTSAFDNVSFSAGGVSYNLRRSTNGYNDPFDKGCFIAQHDNGMNVAYDSWVNNVPGSSVLTYDIPTPSYENADFIIYLPKTKFSTQSALDSDFDPKTDGLYLCLKLKPIAKHLRQIFIGCGYQFNPFDKYDMYFNPFKLFAFYKSWFDLMRPTRDLQFTNTSCYGCLSRCKSANAFSFVGQSYFAQFLYDLAFDTYFYTQPDYFSASISSIGDNNGNYPAITVDPQNNRGIGSSPTSLGGLLSAYPTNSVNYPLLVQAMMKMMRFTSKNNVIGRSIRDYVKVHYGIDDVEHDNKSVNKIGAVRCDIFFDDVMSNAATQEANLGEYGGKGIGVYPKQGEKPKKFIFEAPDYGYFICLSVVVPEAGYYQGYMLENKHLDKYQFWSEEYDAVGYQVLEKGEIKSDYEVQSPNFDPSSQIGSDGFGFIPRYSEYKVGRNIVNGDLTLRSSRNGLDGYFLDKRFASIKEEYDANGILQLKSPDYIPNSITQQFRKIDPSDNVGNYNRIFNYTKIDEDHFIIQKVFDFKVSAPWKSLSNSFDTIQEGEEVIERNHQ